MSILKERGWMGVVLWFAIAALAGAATTAVEFRASRAAFRLVAVPNPR